MKFFCQSREHYRLRDGFDNRNLKRDCFVLFRLPAVILFTCCLLIGTDLVAQDELPTEDDYYKIVTIPTPEDVVLEVGAIEILPEDRLAVSSRRGDIYLFEQAMTGDGSKVESSKFIGGLHEVLGVSYRDGAIFATQRGEVSKLVDLDGDDRADRVERFASGWEINGDYHEYAFGSDFDKEGNLWVVLCLTGSFGSDSLFRGWCLRVTPDGEIIPTCSGIRSPGGIGMNAEGDMFYTDNQGPWNGTCGLKWLRPGSFQGHPVGNRWYDQAPNMGARPEEPTSGSRIMKEFERVSQLEPTAVMFPYRKMGQSASGIACDQSEGKFGPFANQLFVADQTQSTVMRVYLEKVNGHYQGACFPFKEGFGSGNVALKFAPNGSLFVGGTNRGWGSTGNQPFALERLDWTGKTPFEIEEMRALPDGFELTFTKPVDHETAGDVASYSMPTFTYIYQSSYGSPEVDADTIEIVAAEVAADGMSVRLTLDHLNVGHVHELHVDGVRSKEGLPLLHSVAYYTLNFIPEP